jgi:hypothetical protein
MENKGVLNQNARQRHSPPQYLTPVVAHAGPLNGEG